MEPYTLGKDVGTNLDPYCDHCGYPIEEYLSHIIQVCDRTHGPRIHRHNLLVHKLVKMLRAKGWQTLCEPIIKTSNTWVKPDIIAWKEDQSVVIDAIVHSDASKYSPNKFQFDKVAKYEAIPEVTTYVKNLTGHTPKFSALAMNWRGIIAPQTEQDMRSLRIRKKDLSFLSIVCIEQSTWIHQKFQQMLSKSTSWRKKIVLTEAKD